MILPGHDEGRAGPIRRRGIAQIPEVRLIHATIRNLILRRSPADALPRSAPSRTPQVPAWCRHMRALRAGGQHASALFAHGLEDAAEEGLHLQPGRLAYTLAHVQLCFPCAAMRRLGLIP